MTESPIPIRQRLRKKDVHALRLFFKAFEEDFEPAMAKKIDGFIGKARSLADARKIRGLMMGIKEDLLVERIAKFFENLLN